MSLANTHPFVHGPWVFAHNGTVAEFEDTLRRRLLAATAPPHRAAIRGQTDSEHVFRMVLTAFERAPDQPKIEVLAEAVEQIAGWCDHLAVPDTLSLNVLLTDGRELLGTRLGRGLHVARTEGVDDCWGCGLRHVEADPTTDYYAIEVASEPIAGRQWSEVPERSVFSARPETGIEVQPLRVSERVAG